MKVTVIVRTYNRPEFLKQALASIQLQTHTDWEVLIFDDGATDINFDVYKKHDAAYPSFSIRSDKGKMGFHFDSDDLPASEVESDIMDVSKNDYLNYLLKKSLGIETHSDKERLYKHFVDSINSHDFDYIKSDDIKTQEKGKRSADYIKSLKNMVSTFVPEKRISEVYPRKD
jgi:glycosyltransferase involved in cell wall biosynthesis